LVATYTKDQLVQATIAAAKRHGIDPDIFVRQINQESGFNPNAVSSAGARGIAQFMPATAKGFSIDPMEPMQALDAGARYMKNGLAKYGTYELALAAYNAGGGNVEKYKGIPPFKETQHYVKTIMGGSYAPSNGSQTYTTGGTTPSAGVTAGTPGALASAAAMGQLAPVAMPESNLPELIRRMQESSKPMSGLGVLTTPTINMRR